jgi:hypothetical protein
VALRHIIALSRESDRWGYAMSLRSNVRPFSNPDRKRDATVAGFNETLEVLFGGCRSQEVYEKGEVN